MFYFLSHLMFKTSLRVKGWTKDLRQEVQLVLPQLRPVHRIPAPKTIDSLPGVMSQHGAGKSKLGVCIVYFSIDFVHCPPPPLAWI